MVSLKPFWTDPVNQIALGMTFLLWIDDAALFLIASEIIEMKTRFPEYPEWFTAPFVVSVSILSQFLTYRAVLRRRIYGHF